ncbi:MAG: alpha/beta hydrolase [Solirubrobacterales bacterium]
MSPGTVSPAEPLEWSSIPVGGVQTRLVQAGPHQASEAVVFIHGNPGSASDWTGLVEETGRIGRAVAFDLPDFGQTVAEPGFGNSVEEYAGFIGRALKTLGISSAQLVLHDFGGPIGLTWAAANTNRVAGVTLIDTGVLLDYKWHRTARIWQTPGLGELLNMTANRAVFRRLISSPEPRGLPAAFIDEMYDNLDRRTRSAVLRLYRDQKKIGKTSKLLVPALAAADIPALVIWGGGDTYLPVPLAERQKEAFPSASVHVLPGSGHWPFIDDPTTVARLLMEFLRSSV